MKGPFTYASKHAAIVDDRAFFAANPHRFYRARLFRPEEFGWPINALMLTLNENGEAAVMNLVILERISTGRIRSHFAVSPDLKLNTDAQIEGFLRSRGFSPPQRNRRRQRT